MSNKDVLLFFSRQQKALFYCIKVGLNEPRATDECWILDNGLKTWVKMYFIPKSTIQHPIAPVFILSAKSLYRPWQAEGLWLRASKQPSWHQPRHIQPD